MGRVSLKTLALLAVAGGAIVSSAHAGPMYNIVDLGAATLNFEGVQFGINDAGQVVGYKLVNGSGVPVRTTPNGTFATATTISGYARRINNNAISAGFDGDVASIIDASDPGVKLNLGNLVSASGAAARSFGLNNLASPQVVGLAYPTAAGNYHAFLWQQGSSGGSVGNPQMRDLGVLATDFAGRPDILDRSVASAINDSGVAVGWAMSNPSGAGSYAEHAFVWTSGGTAGPANNPQMRDLGSLGGTESHAYDINSSGQVVGYAYTPNVINHAFIWTESGGMVDIHHNPYNQGNPSAGGSSASAINDSGVVVGSLGTGAINTTFVYADNTMYDLAAAISADAQTHWSLSDASDINNSGQIVGWGYFDDDGPGGIDVPQLHAFRLDPVPEPGSLAVLGFASVLVARRRR